MEGSELGSDTVEWAWLDKRTSRALLEELPRVFGAKIPALIHDAGLGMQTEGGRMALRARTDAGSLVYAEPLQTRGGELRDDAAAVLTRDALDRPTDVQRWLGMDFERLIAAGELEVSRQNLLQLQLWTNSDCLPVIAAHLQSGNRFFRVGAHQSLYGRMRLLEIVADLKSGVPVESLRIGPRAKYNTLVSGIWQLYPGSLICFPMAARHQPLALLYMTPVGSQIAMLPPKGHVFKRPMQLFGWPVGTVGQTLEGPGKGIYRNAGKPWEGDGAREILEACVQGADALLKWITDPGELARCSWVLPGRRIMAYLDVAIPGTGCAYSSRRAVEWTIFPLGWVPCAWHLTGRLGRSEREPGKAFGPSPAGTLADLRCLADSQQQTPGLVAASRRQLGGAAPQGFPRKEHRRGSGRGRGRAEHPPWSRCYRAQPDTPVGGTAGDGRRRTKSAVDRRSCRDVVVGCDVQSEQGVLRGARSMVHTVKLSDLVSNRLHQPTADSERYNPCREPIRAPFCAPISPSSPMFGNGRREPDIPVFGVKTPGTNAGEIR